MFLRSPSAGLSGRSASASRRTLLLFCFKSLPHTSWSRHSWREAQHAAGDPRRRRPGPLRAFCCGLVQLDLGEQRGCRLALEHLSRQSLPATYTDLATERQRHHPLDCPAWTTRSLLQMAVPTGTNGGSSPRRGVAQKPGIAGRTA